MFVFTLCATLGGDGDYAEVNEVPKKETSETEGNEPVSKAKFNLIMERLKFITVIIIHTV